MNVLLVDDEDYVLDYLEETIKWPTFGITSLYRANSVDEALEIIHHIPISITITDIRMPEKSGLELLSAIKENNFNIKVILLTGYSEFEYARQALQHGAADYLLKPVTNEEVEISLQNLLTLIGNENKNKEEILAAEDVLRNGISRMRTHLLLDLLLGKRYPNGELDQQLSSLRLSITSGDECVLALLRIETELSDSSAEDLELFHYAIVNIAEEIFKEKGIPQPNLWTCSDSHNYLIMMLPLEYLGGLGHITEGINQLHHAVKLYIKRTVSILVSRPLFVNEKLDQIYLQALNQFWSLIGIRNDVMLTLDQQLNTTTTKMRPLVRLYETPSLMQLFESGRWDEAVHRLEFVLAELNMPDYQTQEHATEVVYHLYNCFSYLAHRQGDSFIDLLGNSLSNQLQRFHSTEAIRSWANTLIEQFRVSLHDSLGNQNRIMRQIQEYIEQNLQSDLSLTVIGEHVYLHPVYLSRLYKKATGESFSSYITRVRMEKAALLLTSTNKKVYDIACEVGYQKTQYFIRLFKEYYGYTPQSYRNR
ncbi:response regulator [Paenibacillus sp. LMG 31461]|uniref:Response regulator n=1 Tax=Paenibacillus plantarum TaxID=2654975 RepID=A0ABX1X361_9BACL|nr:response regulator [Paenibacillus plantarum]NOU62835.1 response regulator [Paenibacillus plantarum]